MTHNTTPGYKAVGGASFKAVGFRALRTLPLIFLFPFLSASCEKDAVRYAEIADYHAESQNLYVASADSVGKFTQKV